MRRFTLLGATLLFIAFITFAGLRLWEAVTSYSDARQESVALRDYAEYTLQELSDEDLGRVEQHLDAASQDLSRLHGATGIPIVGGIVEQTPWVGPRYEAQRQAIVVAQLATEAGQRLAVLLQDVRQDPLLQQDMCLAADDGELILLMLLERQAELDSIALTVSEARRVEQDIDESHLTTQARSQLDDVRKNLDRFEQLDRSIDDLVTSGASLESQLIIRATQLPTGTNAPCSP